MRIATWNVNSLRVRLPHLQEWLATRAPDVVCLQETKVPDDAFPYDELARVGYHAHYCGQKSYNGVAILARQPGSDVRIGIDGYGDDQKRVIGASVGGVRVLSVYVPNGSAVGSDKYVYKLEWLARFTEFVRAELARSPRLAILGDFNVAPEDRDVHDPKAWEGAVLVSEPERAAFRGLLALGLVDVFRSLEPEAPGFTWWDYRLAAFRRDLGLRIDHVLASKALADDCLRCEVDRAPRALERPSDHAPLIVELSS